jgi:opacity protein-like surface antigen
MKRILASLLCLGLLAVAVPAKQASAEGVYVAPKIIWGVTQLQGIEDSAFSRKNKIDNVFGGALAVGVKANPARVELEYGVFSEASGKNKDDDGDYVKLKTQAQTLFVNAYFDIDTATPFTPYVGAGLGLAFLRSKGNWNILDVSESYGSKTKTNFAWNLGAGVAYDFTQNVALDLGYRFAGLGKARTGTDIADDRARAKNVYMHQFMLGLRFSF